jgi:hypothetical protein
MAMLVTLTVLLASFALRGNADVPIHGCRAGFDTHPIRAGPRGL